MQENGERQARPRQLINRGTIQSVVAVSLVMLLAAVTFSLMFERYVLEKAEENVANLLLSHKGIHHYVQNVLLPAYQQYQDQGKIAPHFYAPELLSSSFIVRNQHEFYNRERSDTGYNTLYYKLAANNPRNPINQADALERSLIRLFNEKPEIKVYKDVMTEGGERVLYVAIPFLKNEAHCMRCHGVRGDAPQELQDRYPGLGGFNERLGEVRAITSIRAPLAHEYTHIYTIALTIFVGCLSFVGLFFFNTRLKNQVQKKTLSLEEEIEERKRAEGILNQNRSMIKQILDTTPQSIFWKDVNGVYQGANQVFLRGIGLESPDQVLGKTDLDLPWPKEEAEAYRKDDLEVIENKRAKLHIEEPLQLSSGQRIWVDTSKVPLLDNRGEVCGVLGVYQDISERKKVLEELRIKESAIADAINAIALIDLEGRLTYVNRSFLNYWALERAEEARGKPVGDLFNSSEQGAEFLYGIKAKGRCVGEYLVKRKDGSLFNVQVSSGLISDDQGKPICIMASFLDVTERLKLEYQIRQAQRLESMGTLAGGIAHDFNNILSPILGYADMVLEQLPQGSQLWHYQQSVLRAGYRARDLVQQILAIASQVEHERHPIQILTVVKEAVKLLRASIPTAIEIKLTASSTDSVALADPTQIHQIVMNLCTNAYHAMEKTGGVLSITLDEVVLSEEDQLGSGIEVKAGNYLRLGFGDTGHGMDAKVLGRIFEPYFTTKQKGKGTGLGLAMVHGIVKAHGGYVTVYSELGEGTTFNVYLPRSGQEVARRESTQRDGMKAKNHERVLIVDDEVDVGQMENTMLKNLGYQAMVLRDSQEAWELLQKEPQAFDLLITDMTMPKMSGVELAKRYLQIRPKAKILLCTGFSELISEEKAKFIGITQFIMKPIVKSELAKVVRRTLDS